LTKIGGAVMMDFSAVMKVKDAWDTFSRNHPKFMPFMHAVSREAITDGTIIEIKVTSPEGKEYNTNMKITQSDLDLFEQMKTMM
jgi:hypothetical protein